MRKVLVFGATGTQGHPVVDAMQEKGYEVRAGVRDYHAAEQSLPTSVEIVEADLEDGEEVADAMAGIDAVFFHIPILPDDSLAPKMLRNVISGCDKQGVRRLIFTTSGFCHESMPDGAFVSGLRQASRAVLARQGEAVVLRPTLYLANLVWPYLIDQIRNHGRLTYPPLSYERRISWTATEDQATIAAACVEADVAGEILDIASPEPVTGPELCQMLAGVYDREVHYAPQSPEDFADNLGKIVGSTETERAMAELYRGIDALPADGMIFDTTELEQRLGVRLTPVSEWMEDRLKWLVELTS